MATDPLELYKQKRDFKITPEPEGKVAEQTAVRSFVIQKHAATRLHYDFRLELDGTLKSWAVPKGPSLDPADKRMAVHVEDHPLSYGGFEGVIPPKQYGAGTVIVWDRGTWEAIGDPHEGYRDGKLKFRLQGEKLHGGWTLVRMHGKQDQRQEPWLLIKERDDHARPSAEYNIVEAKPASVLSGRSVSEADGPRSLRGGAAASATAARREPAAKKAKRTTKKPADEEPEPAEVDHRPPNTDGNPKHASGLAALTGSRRSPLPALLQPQLATLVENVPPSDGWIYEIKFDGYRLLARVDKNDVRLFTRNGNDWTSKLTRLAAAIEALRLPPSWLDGEIVVLDESGVPDFGLLQNAFDDASTDRIQFYVFDIPYHAGLDLTGVPLRERRTLLRSLVADTHSPKVKFSESFDAHGNEVLANACRLGLEGIVGKRADSGYVSRRSPNWIKIKCSLRQEFVIVGYTDPKGSRNGIGAMLLAIHDDEGKLRYAGKVGTGFDSDTLDELKALLSPLKIAHTALIDKPAEARGHWVEPKIVAEVSFGEWTKGGIIRHSVFRGIRTDMPASAITRECASAVSATTSMPPESSMPAKAARRTTTQGTKTGTSRNLKAVHPSLADARITHPERVIDPSSGLTKFDLVNYYAHAAPHLLPHLARRPVSLVRAPSGIEHQLFFQKHSDTLKIAGLKELDPSIDRDHPPYIEVPNATTLVGAAQMNVIEFHTWNSTTKNIDKPDRMLFDLDPGEGLEWGMMLEAAHLVKTFLYELGLVSFLKTSGGKGLHVVVPLTPRDDYDTVKDFSRRVVEHIARIVPSRFVAKSGASNRVGKIFIDYLRNGRGATTASAWSARARKGLGVSVPCGWGELDTLKSGSQWTIVDAHERFDTSEKAWATYAKTRQTLVAPMKRLAASC